MRTLRTILFMLVLTHAFPVVAEETCPFNPGCPPPPLVALCDSVENPTSAGAYPIVDVSDRAAPFGIYDQADITAAIEQECKPARGCDLEFREAVYKGVRMDIFGGDFDHFRMYGAGIGKTILESYVYLNTDPSQEPFDSVVQFRVDPVTNQAPPSNVLIQHMTIDGQKELQRTVGDPELHNGIRYWPYTLDAASVWKDGLLQCVEVKNVLTTGITMRNLEDWTLRGNTVVDVGCHNCDSCVTCWENEPDIENVPGRKTNGKGIQIGRFSNNTLVEDNVVSHATKMGMQLWTTNDPVNPYDCTHASGQFDTTLRNNLVEYSGVGIFVNGACRTVLEDNTVRNSIVSGAETIRRMGVGFGCKRSGGNTIWRDNLAENNQSEGFQIECVEGNLLLESNTSKDNCTTLLDTVNLANCKAANDCKRMAEVQLFHNQNDASPDPTVTVSGHSVPSTHCLHGLRASDRDDVTVSGGSFRATETGILATNASDVVIENVTVTREMTMGAGVTTGMDIGADLEFTYVQDSSSFSGFVNEYRFASQYGGLNDGDSVAYCRYEDPYPAFTAPNPPCCLPTQDPACAAILP